MGGVVAVLGGILAAAGLAIIAREAFPVQGEQVLWPGIGVACVAASAVLLRLDPIAPLRKGNDPGVA